MGSNERHGSGSFINFSALDSNQAIFNHIDSPNSLSASSTIHNFNSFEHRNLLTIDVSWCARLKGYCYFVWRFIGIRSRGIRVNIFNWTIPDIFKKTGFYRTPPNILIYRIWTFLIDIYRKIIFFCKYYCFISRHRRVSDGRKDL